MKKTSLRANKTSLKKAIAIKKPALKSSSATPKLSVKPKPRKAQGPGPAEFAQLLTRLAQAVEKLERVAEQLAGASGRTLHAQDEAIEATTVREDEAPELTDVREAGKHD